jgi:chemotaxis protein CheZ
MIDEHFTNEDALAKAKQLVAALEGGDPQEIEKAYEGVAKPSSDTLFLEVGRMTRELHDALNAFQIDPRIAKLTADEIPDAKKRLTHVIQMTEKAAHDTMDAIDRTLPMAQSLKEESNAILPDWERLLRRELSPGEFRVMYKRLDILLRKTIDDSTAMHEILTEVMTAQGFQDLTGQILKKVITLVQDVENSLVKLIKTFGGIGEYRDAVERGVLALEPENKKDEAEGPILDAEERDDVVNGQDDVDDLLSSLGF